MKLKKSKNLKNTLRITMSILIIVPVLLVSIVGIVAVSRQMTEVSVDTSACSAHSRGLGISALIGEYIAFLDAAAGLDIMQNAGVDVDARESARAFMSVHAQQIPGVHDILLTNTDGQIFASHSQSYASTDLFRDTSALNLIAATPTPVSEFYENESRFFLARPLGTSGYIVLKVDTSLIVDYISRTAGDSGTIFAIFDESGRVIGYNGNSGGSLGRSIEDYFRIDAELLDENGRFIRSRHYGSVGTIQGTRWRWIALEPVSNSNTSSWSVFGPALAIATGLGFANLILLLKLSKSMFKPLLPVTRTLERACGSATEEPVFQKLDLDFGGDFGGIVGDLNAILEDTESTLQDAQRSAGDADDFVPASDFLTGLHDRGTFTALLGETLTHSPNAANAAVMFVEVDNFKAVSTEFGHKAGDEMVRFTAEKLHNTVKAISQESFAGRLGGAVFALCITECPDSVANTDSLEQVCTYLDEELQKGYFCPIASTQIRVTTKIGVAVNGKQVDSAATIMAQADEAVYLARKNSGANAGAVSETHELANYHVFRTPEPANPAENIENIIKTETKS